MRILLLLALLPVLVVGPALGGIPVWLHAHGASGAHLHLPAGEPEPAEGATLHDWHDAQHRHADEDGAHPEDEPAPAGLWLELPEIVAVPSTGQAWSSIASLDLPALLAAPRWHVASIESLHRPELSRSGWPPQGTRRSGIAGLLRSSHAILI